MERSVFVVKMRFQIPLSVLQIFRSVVDDPVADRCQAPPAQRPHHHPDRPSSIVAPNRFHQNENLDGAAVDLTIVRPAAAAPPSRLEQVGLRQSSLESALVSLARAWGQRIW
jgi:hypothetical protein